MNNEKSNPYTFTPDLENRKYVEYLAQKNRRSMSASINILMAEARKNDQEYGQQGKKE